MDILRNHGDAVRVIHLLIAEIERLETENWQLKQACGYPVPSDKETINNPFKCGICDARNNEKVNSSALVDRSAYSISCD